MLRQALTVAMILLMTPVSVRAASLDEQVAEQLRIYGYTDVEISHTLLGRLRVVGHDGDREREIIVNPRTGEILRDYTSGGSSGPDGPRLFPGLAPPGAVNAPDWPDSPDVPDRPDRPGRPEPPDRPDGPDRPDFPDRPDTPDRPDWAEGPDRPNGPDRPERPPVPPND